MKKFLILSLCICLTSLACDKENNGSPKSGNDYYMFSITIDGVNHKVEGNYSSYYAYAAVLGNGCYASLTTNGALISAGLADKGAASYISGDVFSIQLNFSNLSIGVNEVENILTLNMDNLNWPETFCGFSENTAASTGTISYAISLENFMITSLGSAGTINPVNINNPYTFGDPVIGNFSGTVYGCSTNSFPDVYDVPVQLEIEFVAPRLYY